MRFLVPRKMRTSQITHQLSQSVLYIYIYVYIMVDLAHADSLTSAHVAYVATITSLVATSDYGLTNFKV